MFKVFIDSMIYNFTPFKSFFFLTNINSRGFVYNLTVGLFVDLFVIHSFPLNALFMCIVYLIHKHLKINYYNVINYYVFNIVILFGYYLLFASIYNFKNIFFNMFIINSVFIIISYIKDSKNIKLYR